LVSLKKLPFATIAFIVASVAFSYYLWYFAPMSFQRWLFLDPTGQLVLVLIHPIVHVSVEHLVGNMVFGIAILGTLIESWMTLLTRRLRYGMLVFCYLASLAVSVLVWKSPILGPIPAIGSSGLIFAALPFALFYCLAYFKRTWFKTLNLLALVGIVIVSAFLVAPIIFSQHLKGGILLGISPFLHLMSFLISFVFAGFLFDRKRPATRQPDHSTDPSTTTTASHSHQLTKYRNTQRQSD